MGPGFPLSNWVFAAKTQSAQSSFLFMVSAETPDNKFLCALCASSKAGGELMGKKVSMRGSR